MQHVGIFTILIVLQNCYTGIVKLLLESFRTRFLQEIRSLAPTICALYVKNQRISQLRRCRWLFVIVVRRHTMKNACLVRYPLRKMKTCTLRKGLGKDYWGTAF